jgi:hypothetical protein
MSDDGQPAENADAMLVGHDELIDAAATVPSGIPAGGFTFVETEPVLSEYCHDELLRILGKLAVAGASSGVVRGVGADIHRLITVTATAMRSAYGSLLEDFLPEFAVSVPESQEESEDED